MGSHSSNMFQTILKTLLLITLGQYVVMGQSPSIVELRGLFREIDLDRNERLSFEEVIKKYPDEPEKKWKTFQKADTNNDGSLDFNEFVTIIYEIIPTLG